MGLYTKQEGVHPEKSLVGCLVATVGMVAIIAVYAIVQGTPFILGNAEAARQAQAQRAMDRIVAAAAALAEDAEVERLDGLFKAEALDDADPEALSRWLRQVLRHGAASDAPLRDEVRDAIQNEYIDFGQDPWGRSYELALPDSDGEAYVVVRLAGSD